MSRSESDGKYPTTKDITTNTVSGNRLADKTRPPWKHSTMINEYRSNGTNEVAGILSCNENKHTEERDSLEEKERSSSVGQILMKIKGKTGERMTGWLHN